MRPDTKVSWETCKPTTSLHFFHHQDVCDHRRGRNETLLLRGKKDVFSPTSDHRRNGGGKRIQTVSCGANGRWNISSFFRAKRDPAHERKERVDALGHEKEGAGRESDYPRRAFFILLWFQGLSLIRPQGRERETENWRKRRKKRKEEKWTETIIFTSNVSIRLSMERRERKTYCRLAKSEEDDCCWRQSCEGKRTTYMYVYTLARKPSESLESAQFHHGC